MNRIDVAAEKSGAANCHWKNGLQSVAAVFVYIFVIEVGCLALSLSRMHRGIFLGPPLRVWTAYACCAGVEWIGKYHARSDVDRKQSWHQCQDGSSSSLRYVWRGAGSNRLRDQAKHAIHSRRRFQAMSVSSSSWLNAVNYLHEITREGTKGTKRGNEKEKETDSLLLRLPATTRAPTPETEHTRHNPHTHRIKHTRSNVSLPPTAPLQSPRKEAPGSWRGCSQKDKTRHGM
jgi:hypothetical protein